MQLSHEDDAPHFILNSQKETSQVWPINAFSHEDSVLAWYYELIKGNIRCWSNAAFLFLACLNSLLETWCADLQMVPCNSNTTGIVVLHVCEFIKWTSQQVCRIHLFNIWTLICRSVKVNLNNDTMRYFQISEFIK